MDFYPAAFLIEFPRNTQCIVDIIALLKVIGNQVLAIREWVLLCHAMIWLLVARIVTLVIAFGFYPRILGGGRDL